MSNDSNRVLLQENLRCRLKDALNSAHVITFEMSNYRSDYI